METRQLFPRWDAAIPPDLCSATLLAANGGALLLENGGRLLRLSRDAVYFAHCPGGGGFLLPREDSGSPLLTDEGSINLDGGLIGDNAGFADLRDPFYASLFPVFYALAATTVTAYMLVIMLFITPRAFVNGGVVYLGRHNRFTNSSPSTVTLGGRPWLQKVAALSVAISLTVASGLTFHHAELQYQWGMQDAHQLQVSVMDSTALKVIRLISDTFLWLAQAQTLIRLFQRQREKIIIKWAAFALITLDVIFSALNSFQNSDQTTQGSMRPQSFVDAIPALSYLFQLSLGLLYAAWVIYYAILKKRYSFYHPLMKNMPLVATISLFSILIPVVFFIIDISKPEFTGWGDYVRWVGAAAASVVVWEWVERIEALEREEKKDGILGRQVFDGDDIVGATASSDTSWSRRLRKQDSDESGDGSGRGYGPLLSGRGSIIASLASRYRHNGGSVAANSVEGGERDRARGQETTENLRPPPWPTHPPPTVTPISRTDTTSAASTVYTVRYQPHSDGTGRTPDPDPRTSPGTGNREAAGGAGRSAVTRSHSLEMGQAAGNTEGAGGSNGAPGAVVVQPIQQHHRRPSTEFDDADDQGRDSRWPRLVQMAKPLFHRGGSQSTHDDPELPGSVQHRREDLTRFDWRSKLEDFAATQAEKFREKMRPPTDTDNMRVMVIPAPPRRGAALEQLLEEEERSSDDLDPTRTRDTPESQRVDSPNGAQDPNFVAPPMWPGVYPQIQYAESSRAGSIDSVAPSRSGSRPSPGR
ncbi:hypothetical protein jhhlp_004693 [Lomentospora prolificans]|uniref:PH-response regulator protein palH/RIM21 n=1 Tax=Lomentospora prolificans TaxID=41688 RepID=A0A2N3NCB2_9PEZI|nr:hypothetical protein jhhlp_004693 [Lomentospora prolificans]